jgi:hypothetical protein
MTCAQRRNRLTTPFSERIPVVKRRISVFFLVIALAISYFMVGDYFQDRNNYVFGDVVCCKVTTTLCRVYWYTDTKFSEASAVSVYVIEDNDDGGTRFLRNASSYVLSHEMLVFVFTAVTTARATSQLLKSLNNPLTSNDL